jgi:hypothetical protein
MNYQKIYNQIVQRAQNRELIGYGEKHHIIPTCLGGDNYPENIVKLTAREHFICHKLLCSIYPKNASLIGAHWLMANKVSSIHERTYRVGSREYSRLRIEYAEIMKNRKISTETRNRMSISAKLRENNQTGLIRTKETISKLRKNSPNSKKILHIESGILYRSMREAARQCDITSRTIFQHCNDLVITPKFKYYENIEDNVRKSE